MHEQLWFTAFLNHLFAGPVTGLLRTLHLEPKYPDAPIANSVAMELLVFIFLVIVFALVRSRFSVDKPGCACSTFSKALTDSLGARATKSSVITARVLRHFLLALGFFILICNLIGVIPGFESPTAVPVVPLGCAISAFVYYQVQGFKHAGVAYLKHFAGPMPGIGAADGSD